MRVGTHQVWASTPQMDVAFRLLGKDKPLPIFGDGKCGCSSLILQNPNIFQTCTPMINVGKFSAKVIQQCLVYIPQNERQLFGMKDVQIHQDNPPTPQTYAKSTMGAQSTTRMTPSPIPSPDATPLATIYATPDYAYPICQYHCDV